MFGLEIIPIGIAGAAAVLGHLKSRSFVRRRLRYTTWVEKPGFGIAAGVAAAVVAAPIMGILPFLGAGSALLFGACVGTGVALGAKDAKEGSVFDND